MRKGVLAIAGIFAFSTAFGAAYKIPEQSTRSMGTAAAYFAGADGADTAYYNPAGMSWLGDKDKTLTELGIKYIYLPRIKFTGQAFDPVFSIFTLSNAETSKEEFVIPYFHMILPAGEKFRVGFSFVTPYGLSKRWSAQGQKAYAEEFTLKTFEFDTTVSYVLDNRLSLGAGVRALYATGQIKYSYNGAYKIDMEGESGINFGYLISASLKLSDSLNVSTIYRSEIKPEVSGTATGYLGAYPISTEGNVKVVLPAEWRLGIAYKPTDKTIIDLTYEITFWGRYKRLDINFEDPVAESNLGKSKPKYWHDSKTIRLGLRHKINQQFTGMLGIAYDETPIPQKTLGFELPDSNGWIFSVGGLWNPNKNLEVCLAYLYVKKFDRYVSNNYMNGNFTDMAAHLVNLSVGYKF
ncbi:transporter [Persephonella atlantica]|uniref:Transporter n=1 Tax=Persephonella atlantica TaxID=2699429 RepID=A0ABS1GFQ9_9AQUI|nr:OmpP1/FadL family transporter [Persephonella atlantica]MBK3331759.1 transporter [Persephonella atlantica]